MLSSAYKTKVFLHCPNLFPELKKPKPTVVFEKLDKTFGFALVGFFGGGLFGVFFQSGSTAKIWKY